MNVSPVDDDAVFVEAMETTALISSNFITLSKFGFMHEKSRGLKGKCEIPYDMLSKASSGIFCDLCHYCLEVLFVCEESIMSYSIITLKGRVDMVLGAYKVFHKRRC